MYRFLQWTCLVLVLVPFEMSKLTKSLTQPWLTGLSHWQKHIEPSIDGKFKHSVKSEDFIWKHETSLPVRSIREPIFGLPLQGLVDRGDPISFKQIGKPNPWIPQLIETNGRD